MILYKKAFPLGKDISFFHFMTALRKGYFPNFVLTIDKISATENYQAQLFFTTPSFWRWGFANAFLDGVFLNKCTIQYLEDEEYFILQASPKRTNLYLASLYAIFAILFFVSAIFMIAINGGVSLNTIFGFAISIIIILAPLTLIYLRDKKFWDKVGSLATGIN